MTTRNQESVEVVGLQRRDSHGCSHGCMVEWLQPWLQRRDSHGFYAQFLSELILEEPDDIIFA